MKKHLFFFIFATVVCSCTITKRHFGNGYHVEWNRKVKTGTGWEENSKIESPENQVALKSIDERDSVPVDKVAIHDQPIAVSDIESTEVSEIHPVKQPQVWSGTMIKKNRESKESKRENEPEEEPTQRMHPLMWGIWGMWSIAIACMFFVTFYAEFLIGVALGFLVAMIFAFIVINALRTHPGKYRFKGLSYGFVIPAIVFGTIAFLGFVIFLLGGVPLGPGG